MSKNYFVDKNILYIYKYLTTFNWSYEIQIIELK
jgi:hypothetical protein